MNSRKPLEDWLIATQESLAALQTLALYLDQWRATEQVDEGEFAAVIHQLREAGLAGWVNEAGGHGLAALAHALNLEFHEENYVYQ